MGGPERFTVALRGTPLAVAVTVAGWSLVKVPAVAVKVAVSAAGATVTEAGTVSRGLLLARVTGSPPAGEARDSVAVQVLDPPEETVPGVQTNEATTGGETRLKFTFCEPVPNVAVTEAG